MVADRKTKQTFAAFSSKILLYKNEDDYQDVKLSWDNRHNNQNFKTYGWYDRVV